MNRPEDFAFISIKELEYITGVPASTIKRWSSRGLISKPRKVSDGRYGFRGLWTRKNIDEIVLIRKYVKNNHMTLHIAKIAMEEELKRRK